MQITIDIPKGQEDAVLDAFAGDAPRSEETVTAKLTEIVAVTVAGHRARAAQREAAQSAADEVGAAFGVDVNAQARRAAERRGGRGQ